MPPSRAFAGPIELTGGVLRIDGSSNPLAAGEPESCHVALEQAEAAFAGPASTGAGRLWDAALLLSFSRAQTVDVDAT